MNHKKIYSKARGSSNFAENKEFALTFHLINKCRKLHFNMLHKYNFELSKYLKQQIFKMN